MANKSAQMQQRSLLVKVSQCLSLCDLEELIFLCEPEISESVAEEIHSGISLFRTLEHRALLGPNNCDFLRWCLVNIGRQDLASMLPADQKDIADAFSHLNMEDKHTKCSATVLTKEKMLHISTRLTRKDLEKMSYLSSCEFRDGLSMIQELEKNGWIQDSNYTYLSELLTAIGRCDLGRIVADHYGEH